MRQHKRLLPQGHCNGPEEAMYRTKPESKQEMPHDPRARPSTEPNRRPPSDPATPVKGESWPQSPPR